MGLRDVLKRIQKWRQRQPSKSVASHSRLWTETADGLETTTPYESTLRLHEFESMVLMTEQMKGLEEPVSRGVLVRLPGGTWLADEKTEKQAMSIAHERFVQRWGPYLMLGEHDGDGTVCRSSYMSLAGLYRRLEHATQLEVRHDMRVLYRVPLEDATDIFLEVNPTVMPYEQVIMRTDDDLEDRGWSGDHYAEQTLEMVAADDGGTKTAKPLLN